MQELADWKPRPFPEIPELNGRHIAVRPYRGYDEGLLLWKEFGETKTNALLRYFPNPVYESAEQFADWLAQVQENWRTAIFVSVQTGEPLGMGSLMRIDPGNGSVEIGSIAHGPRMARSSAATEAHYLLARHVFDMLGYRRYEWKCDDDNAASKRAAIRLGFVFEGVFRQHMVVKGRNRDTAWFSITDKDWPSRKAAFERWLEPSNFDRGGNQKMRLEELRGH